MIICERLDNVAANFHIAKSFFAFLHFMEFQDSRTQTTCLQFAKKWPMCFDCRHQIATERQIASWQMSAGTRRTADIWLHKKKKREREIQEVARSNHPVDPKLMETKHRTFCVAAVPTVCVHIGVCYYASVIMCIHTPFSTMEWSMWVVASTDL